MSTRGSLAVGKKTIAECKSCIPVAWLALLAVEDMNHIYDSAFLVIPRKTAVGRFSRQSPFLSMLFEPQLPYGSSAAELENVIATSRAKTVAIDISQLIPQQGDIGPGLELVLRAIQNEDAKCSFATPAQTVINPGTGDKVKLKAREWKNTKELVMAICWLTERAFAAPKKELPGYVTGHIWQ